MLTLLLSALCRACEALGQSLGLFAGCADYTRTRVGDIESQEWEREWDVV